jgi:hypothetical protein
MAIGDRQQVMQYGAARAPGCADDALLMCVP